MINDGLISLNVSNDQECAEIFDKQRQQWMSISEYRSIWYRRPKPISEVMRFENSDVRRFVFKEIQHTTRGVLSNFQGIWVNDPYRSSLANYKPHQLSLAREIGFQIPPSLLTTDPVKANQFYEQHDGDVIYKALEIPVFKLDGEYKSTYTTLIPSETSESILNKVQNCPSLLQKHIKKEYELRITVVGDEFFCAKIDSQAHEASTVDWRRHQDRNDVPVTAVDVDESIKAMCLEFMNHFGLVYSAFDFIVDPDGRMVFMENNPHGQWAWVQEATQQPIAQALTHLLAA